ncbi:photoreceptor ankyrin repeat protein [Kryptolebias marmoratus]|uniref:photoreceptor ankyrin repeat protein n=1 Tax=Kryptolebias marmoratus TaxID=37003 RepID=UPI0007F8DB99|nr:photoreceptor ankyrin repeat protein [Kryptolebias marmoratus]
MATDEEDPHLCSGPDDDDDDASPGRDCDADSILSDDSVLPPYTRQTPNRGDASTLYQACACNNRISLRNVLHRGVTKDEVMELDNNGMNGLMVACFKGFVDMVHELHNCPYLDINHQDSEGNTALMIASQAGHINTVMYLLNYYPGINTEMKDCRGFTALIKATMTGRSDVVAALLMAGADIDEVDSTRGACAHDWALKTGRFEVIHRLRRLMARPRAEQFCESYVPEWPELKEKVAKATAQKSPAEKFTLRIKNTFGFSFPRDPKDDGVMDHMVRMTTSIHSPLVSTGCRPLCPASPPEMGRRRLTVQELMRKHPHKELEERSVRHSNGCTSNGVPSARSTEPASVLSCPETDRRGSILSLTSTLIPRSISRRNSVFPSGFIPEISVDRPSDSTPKKEKMRKNKRKGSLEPPTWTYRDQLEEKKKNE